MGGSDPVLQMRMWGCSDFKLRRSRTMNMWSVRPPLIVHSGSHVRLSQYVSEPS